MDDFGNSKWLFNLFLLSAGFYMTGASNRLANEGEAIQLICPHNEVNGWQAGTNEFLVVCEGETPMINFKLNISNRLNISSDCTTLTITYFTQEDAGYYFCYFKDINKSISYTKHMIQVKIRRITIIEANGTNVINRKEGDNVTLTCKVEGAMKDDNLSWIKENIMQSSEKTSDSIIHKFIADRSDNMKEFVCTAKSSVFTRPLTASVLLNLKLKPHIKITSSRNPVITKGQTIILTCNDDDEKNGNIDTFRWTHSSSRLTHNTNNLTLENATQSIAGEYVCIAKNTAGMDSTSINIIVNYPPIVKNQSVMVFTSNETKTLECSATGQPDMYSFGIWHHYTYNNELVRSLEGNTNGTLVLRNIVYEASGMYRCSVSNGVSDERGNKWQSGTMKVTFEGKPVLAKPHHNSFIGQMYATSIISIFVLSSSNVTTAIWFSENKARQKVTPCTQAIAETLFYGIPVKVSGYECQFTINDTRREDLQKYKVDVENKYGISTFNISLILAEEKSNDTENYWVAFLLVFVVIISVCIVLTRWRLRRVPIDRMKNVLT